MLAAGWSRRLISIIRGRNPARKSFRRRPRHEGMEPEPRPAARVSTESPVFRGIREKSLSKSSHAVLPPGFRGGYHSRSTFRRVVEKRFSCSHNFSAGHFSKRFLSSNGVWVKTQRPAQTEACRQHHRRAGRNVEKYMNPAPGRRRKPRRRGDPEKIFQL
jgi:hypothetical protein